MVFEFVINYKLKVLFSDRIYFSLESFSNLFYVLLLFVESSNIIILEILLFYTHPQGPTRVGKERSTPYIDFCITMIQSRY